jgi:anaphase-promoting complex subunit 1
VVFNRPNTPSHAHAGFIMALGLLGHLEALAPPDVYRYLTQEHDATTVGVLIGMAAAKRGSMDSTISKMLFLHIPSRHPPSFPEIELPSAVQAAALLGVGLLYQGSAHRLMTEILLAEIGRKPGPLLLQDREGYALAAGLALGLVTLGKGRSAAGLASLQLEDRLHHLMTGGGGGGGAGLSGGDDIAAAAEHDPFGRFAAAAAAAAEEADKSNAHTANQIMEGNIVNLDVTAPGATLALGLLFLKTNDAAAAARLTVPSTQFALDYVRPDFLLLRICAKNIILWDSIVPTQAWVNTQLPPLLKSALELTTVEEAAAHLASLQGAAGTTEEAADVDLEAMAQAHVNVTAGACLALALRYAGSANAAAAELIQGYLTQYVNLKRQVRPTTYGLQNAVLKARHHT